MKLKEKHTKKATIHRVCTFLMCECDTEELGPTYECDFYFYYQIRFIINITVSNSKWVCLIKMYHCQTEIFLKIKLDICSM